MQQLDIVVLEANNSIILPDAIARQFRPTDRFVLVQEGDTLILKRMAPRVSAIVEVAPADEAAPSLDEISDIVHELRGQRRGV